MTRAILFYVLSMFAVVTLGEVVEMPERRRRVHVVHAHVAR